MSEDVESDLKLEIAHILTIDVVAYSTLLIHEQSRVMAELNRVVRNAPRFRTAEAEGQLIRLPTGDGMALVFRGDPEAPIECAMQIGAELKSRPEIRLRMGIHSGPISQIQDVNDRSNVAGAGIDMAQRVMDCGDAGHILISKRVADDLAPYSRWNSHLHNLGECEVKHGRRVSLVNFYSDGIGNAAVPVKLQQHREAESQRHRSRPPWPRRQALLLISAMLLVVLAGVFASLRRSKPPPRNSIAVLPFVNRTGEQANEYLADGLQDQILMRLGNLNELKVASSTSSQVYRTIRKSLPEIAKELGVALVLEGSFEKSGDNVRLTVQLIEAATDSHIWAETFDRKLTDIFALETDIAKAVVDQLRLNVTGKEEETLSAPPTQNAEAYRAYLRGVASAQGVSANPRTAAAARQHFREAVRLDPSFALSWARLSYADSLGYVTQILEPTAELRDEAKDAAERAVALEPNLGEAVWASGYFYYACLKDYDTALRFFDKARRLLPNDGRTRESLAYIARRRGKWKDCETWFQEAERLDPRNVNLLTQHGLFYVAMRRFPEALQKLDQVLDITPADTEVTAVKAALAQAEGDLPRASAVIADLIAAPGDIGLIETQAYQSILQRRAGEMIPTLRGILDQTVQNFAHYRGELLFWLGWLESESGQVAAAQETWLCARTELEASLRRQSTNASLLNHLALTCAGLRDREAAQDFTQRARAANPVEQDAVAGPASVETAARVSAAFGNVDGAITALHELLEMRYAGPFGTQNVPVTRALLRLDPMFDPLRNDPRFKALVSAGKE